LVADEPVASGGNDTGPDPYELLLMALGACTSATLRLYARRKQWPLERVSVQLRHTRNHVGDCLNCTEKTVRLDHIDRVIQLDGPLDPEQLARLLAIANRCPVHQSLTAGFEITTRLGPLAG
jgi:putative redox protein